MCGKSYRPFLMMSSVLRAAVKEQRARSWSRCLSVKMETAGDGSTDRGFFLSNVAVALASCGEERAASKDKPSLVAKMFES